MYRNNNSKTSSQGNQTIQYTYKIEHIMKEEEKENTGSNICENKNKARGDMWHIRGASLGEFGTGDNGIYIYVYVFVFVCVCVTTDMDSAGWISKEVRYVWIEADVKLMLCV